MNITFQGNPVTIKHEAVKENETLKPFTAIRNDMSEWRSEDSTGTRNTAPATSWPCAPGTP